jgi:hypothetical protein
MRKRMGKFLYVIAILFYGGIGILGLAGNGYMEKGGPDRIVYNNLLLVIFFSIATGLLVTIYFPKYFPKGWALQKRPGRVLIVILFCTLSFAATLGAFMFTNCSFGKQTLVRIDGIINKKWTVGGGKRHDYFLGIRDSISGTYYEFEVKKHIYQQVGERGNRISRNFYKGYFGIIYRYKF